MITCCRYCENHTATCHSECLTYQTEKQQHNQQQSEIKKVKAISQIIRSHTRDTYDRMTKKNNRR